MGLNDWVKVGRPSMGETRKVSITLPEEVWATLDTYYPTNKSKYFRELVLLVEGERKKREQNQNG